MTIINTTLGDILSTTPMGDVQVSEAAELYGINHRMTPGAVSINKDYHGLVLFTRPQLNLTDQNARAMRIFLPLLTTQELSLQRMIRKLLDPRLQSLPCPIVDDRSAFLPILTNHCFSLSGFPDPFVNSYISKPGVQKETFGMIDDVVDLKHNFTVNTSFRNMKGDPLTTLFYLWIEYASAVARGTMLPYADMITSREIDYNTRIWRIVLDKNKKYVTKIGYCGAAYPVNSPLGAAFDFDHSRPINQNNDAINVQFQCFGARYNDPLMIFEFNKLVGYFNPDMRPKRTDPFGEPAGPVVQVPFSDLQIFNRTGYPRIDPDTWELQWWVSKGQYQATQAAYARTHTALNLDETL